MNIGSRVRLIHGKEEGIVTKIGPGKVIEIDLGDGFSIPVLSSEVVLINPLEAKLEQAGTPKRDIPAARATVSTTSSAFATKGIYFAFVPINDRELVLHLINLTGWQLHFTVFGKTEQNLKGLASGVLDGGKTAQITKLLLKEFESWPVFETSLLYYSDQRAPEEFGRRHSLKCRIQSFHKNQQKAPILNVNAHVFQLDAEGDTAGRFNFSGEEIREKMMEKPEIPSFPEVPRKRVPAQIDLHIDALDETRRDSSAAKILEYQLSAFKSYLESAIAEGLDKVTIIHGVGNGKLKQEIHRLLSRHPNVAFFKEGQKEKFGYGATIAQLK